MTQIQTITVKGYKSIAKMEYFALRPINVLIGANGAGKSNFIGIFKLLAALDVSTYVRPAIQSWQQYHFHDTGDAPAVKRPRDSNDNLRLKPLGDMRVTSLRGRSRHFIANRNRAPMPPQHTDLTEISYFITNQTASAGIKPC
jgi:predicted ATPase